MVPRNASVPEKKTAESPKIGGLAPSSACPQQSVSASWITSRSPVDQQRITTGSPVHHQGITRASAVDHQDHAIAGCRATCLAEFLWKAVGAQVSGNSSNTTTANATSANATNTTTNQTNSSGTDTVALDEGVIATWLRHDLCSSASCEELSALQNCRPILFMAEAVQPKKAFPNG